MNRLGYYVTHCRWDEGVRTLSKGIRPKVNAVVRPEFDLFNFEAAVQHIFPNSFCKSTFYFFWSTFFLFLKYKQLVKQVDVLGIERILGL